MSYSEEGGAGLSSLGTHKLVCAPLPQTHSFLNICCLGLICFLPSAFLRSDYLKEPMDGVLSANEIIFSYTDPQPFIQMGRIFLEHPGSTR